MTNHLPCVEGPMHSIGILNIDMSIHLERSFSGLIAQAKNHIVIKLLIKKQNNNQLIGIDITCIQRKV